MGKLLSGLWRAVTSLKLTVALFVVLALFMVAGALLPQGMDDEFYNKAWDAGTYRTLGALGLLDVFHRPVFLIPAALFAINLIACGVKTLVRLGKGVLPRRFLATALYHVALVGMFGGFLGTAFFSYGGELTLKPGDVVAVPLKDGETRWAKLAPRLGLKAAVSADSPFRLRLNRFDTTYTESDGKVYVKDWISDLDVLVDDKVVCHKRIEVNDPLVYGGVKFYQAFFDQKARFDVDGVATEVGIGEPLNVGGRPFMVSTVKNGQVIGDGAPRPIGPYVELKDMPGDKWHKITKDSRPGMKLEMGKPAEVNGHDVCFSSYEETSGLTYKRDGAVKFLWVMWFLFTSLVAYRIYVQEPVLTWFHKKPKP